MFENDYIMWEIEKLTRLLAMAMFHKELDTTEFVDEKGNLSGGQFLSYRLNRMVLEGEIGKAEDLLFESLEEDAGDDYKRAALDFYSALQRLPDEKLEAGGFSREEILEGLEDLRGRFGIMDDFGVEEEAE